jgi:chitin disaccharide deacetylase
MKTGRYLIVNGDDFGQSPGITDGIIKAFEHGILTSTSLMVRWPAAAGAGRYGRAHPTLSVGLHLDFGEWAYRTGEWVQVYDVVDIDDADAVRGEVARQLSTFQDLMGRPPTHLDSHQHVHRSEPLRSVALEAALELGIPLRHVTPHVQYCGSFYGQTAEGAPLPAAIGRDALTGIIGSLPDGWTELICHPAARIDVQTMYGQERLEELATLCDEHVRSCVEQMQVGLRSFQSIPGVGRR